jgi:hypothetical protein
VDVELGDTIDATGTGWRLDAAHKHSFGSRANIELDAGDLGLKVEQEFGEVGRPSACGRMPIASARRSPYSGLTLAEYRDDPRARLRQ